MLCYYVVFYSRDAKYEFSAAITWSYDLSKIILKC